VVGWSWNDSSRRTVLLMHGWGGYAAQMQPLIEALVSAGFRCVALDAPSHGASGPGPLGPKRATLFEFTQTLLAASESLDDITGVIAHSGGCASVAWTLIGRPDWPGRRRGFIAPFGSP